MAKEKISKEKMDKDLLAALVYERSGCWDCGMEAAIKVLKKTPSDSEAAFVARGILRVAGEQYMKQHVLDKAMECYEAMVGYCPVREKGVEGEYGEEPFDIEAITELGAHKVPLSTEVNQDIYEVLQALKGVEGNEEKEEADLLREGVYQVILKYATDKHVRELLNQKMEGIILEKRK
ncbi:MAG: hypothetical protein JRD02_06575 [Deltaproteobacteria bacterium]|nr:hypothetical protein [Deltaproteobacteria bacterium]